MYTQKVSGKVMCDAMEQALWTLVPILYLVLELKDVEYGEDAFVATFTDEKIIDDGMLFLCLDNSPALNFLGDNWGPDALERFREVHMELSMY